MLCCPSPGTEVQSASSCIIVLILCAHVWHRQGAAITIPHFKLANTSECAAVQDVEDQLAELDVQEALGMQAPAGGRLAAGAINNWHPVGLEQVC